MDQLLQQHSQSSLISIPDDANLQRKQLAKALTERGYPIAESTLATRATRGGGPPYRLFNGRALYRWADSLAWAEEAAGPVRASTSAADADRRTAATNPTATQESA